jgi:hypothetical protein
MVTFGTGTEPVYNAGRDGNRATTLNGDTYDALIDPPAGSGSGLVAEPNHAMGTVVPEPNASALLYMGTLAISLRRTPRRHGPLVIVRLKRARSV